MNVNIKIKVGAYEGEVAVVLSADRQLTVEVRLTDGSAKYEVEAAK